MASRAQVMNTRQIRSRSGEPIDARSRSDQHLAKARNEHHRRFRLCGYQHRPGIRELPNGFQYRDPDKTPPHVSKYCTAPQLILRPRTGALLLASGFCNSYAESTASSISRKAQARHAVDFQFPDAHQRRPQALGDALSEVALVAQGVGRCNLTDDKRAAVANGRGAGIAARPCRSTW